MCPMMDYLANNKGVLYADILPTIYEGLTKGGFTMYYDLCLVCNDIVKSKERRYDTNGEPVCPHCNSAGTLAKDMVQISGNNRNIILQRDAQGYSFVYKSRDTI